MLICNGFSCNEVSEIFGHSPRTVQYWVRRFEERGFAGLEETPRSGRPSIYVNPPVILDMDRNFGMENSCGAACSNSKGIWSFGAVRVDDGRLVTSMKWKFNAMTFQAFLTKLYSPELNSIQRVWKLTRRLCCHKRYFPTLDELIETVSGKFAS